MKYRFTPEAESEAERAGDWWRENRPDAADSFDDELAATIEKIRRRPGIGTVYPASFPEEVRRVLMRQTKNHIYFTVHDGEVVILSIWGGPRARGPKL
jgi:plasmid stabilization system protein ParE